MTEKEKYKDKEVKHDLTRRALEGGNWSDRDHPPSMVNTLQCPPNITLFTEETFYFVFTVEESALYTEYFTISHYNTDVPMTIFLMLKRK